MHCLKHLFKSCFRRNKVEPNSPERRLFSFVPFTYVACVLYGVPLSNPTKLRHVIALIVTLIPRIWISYFALKYDFANGVKLIILKQFYLNVLGLITFCLLVKKKSQIVSFLTSDVLLVHKFKRIDLLSVFLFILPPVLHHIPVWFSPHLHEMYRKKFLGSAFECYPILQRVLFYATFVSLVHWFAIASLTVVLYYFGYCVLYAHKVRVLASISFNRQSTNFTSLLSSLNSVSERQKEFETIFGPFLLVCFTYYFMATLYFIDIIRQLFMGGHSHLYYFVAACLFSQATCIGLIFLVSSGNEKVKNLSASVSARLDTQLAQSNPCSFLMVNHLQKRIHYSINEPLTAWKMFTVHRQVILTIATSCVTFSVLFIQINNGALAG